MADVNRHVRWCPWAVPVGVRGSTVVERGDLLFLDRADGLRRNGASTANDTAYPLAHVGGATKTLASNQELAADNFLGVAMGESEAGVTQSIGCAISGHFRYPLKSPKTYRAGRVVMPTGSGTSLYSQRVSLWESGSTHALGHARAGKTRGTDVEFLLRPAVVGLGDKIS